MYYKSIQLTNQDIIIEQLQRHFSNLLSYEHTWAAPVNPIILSRISPELMQNLKQLDLELDVARVFATVPGEPLIPHIDGSGEYTRDLALNIPIYNTQNTFMYWYHIIDETDFSIINDVRYGKGMQSYNITNTKIIDQLELTTPHLLKIGVPHGVVNNNKSGNRIILSLRFKPEPVHLW